MSMPLSYDAGAYALFLSAVGVHLVFRRFEPWSPAIHLILLVAVPCAMSVAVKTNPLLGVPVFWTALIVSIVAYRISPFHPLARFPGPFLERISMFRMAAVSTTGRRHIYIRRLHERYGPFVRIGKLGASACFRR